MLKCNGEEAAVGQRVKREVAYWNPEAQRRDREQAQFHLLRPSRVRKQQQGGGREAMGSSSSGADREVSGTPGETPGGGNQ